MERTQLELSAMDAEEARLSMRNSEIKARILKEAARQQLLARKMPGFKVRTKVAGVLQKRAMVKAGGQNDYVVYSAHVTPIPDAEKLFETPRCLKEDEKKAVIIDRVTQLSTRVKTRMEQLGMDELKKSVVLEYFQENPEKLLSYSKQIRVEKKEEAEKYKALHPRVSHSHLFPQDVVAFENDVKYARFPRKALHDSGKDLLRTRFGHSPQLLQVKEHENRDFKVLNLERLELVSNIPNISLAGTMTAMTLGNILYPKLEGTNIEFDPHVINCLTLDQAALIKTCVNQFDQVLHGPLKLYTECDTIAFEHKRVQKPVQKIFSKVDCHLPMELRPKSKTPQPNSNSSMAIARNRSQSGEKIISKEEVDKVKKPQQNVVATTSSYSNAKLGTNPDISSHPLHFTHFPELFAPQKRVVMTNHAVDQSAVFDPDLEAPPTAEEVIAHLHALHDAEDPEALEQRKAQSKTQQFTATRIRVPTLTDGELLLLQLSDESGSGVEENVDVATLMQQNNPTRPTGLFAEIIKDVDSYDGRTEGSQFEPLCLVCNSKTSPQHSPRAMMMEKFQAVDNALNASKKQKAMNNKLPPISEVGGGKSLLRSSSGGAKSSSSASVLQQHASGKNNKLHQHRSSSHISQRHHGSKMELTTEKGGYMSTTDEDEIDEDDSDAGRPPPEETTRFASDSLHHWQAMHQCSQIDCSHILQQQLDQRYQHQFSIARNVKYLAKITEAAVNDAKRWANSRAPPHKKKISMEQQYKVMQQQLAMEVPDGGQSTPNPSSSVIASQSLWQSPSDTMIQEQMHIENCELFWARFTHFVDLLQLPFNIEQFDALEYLRLLVMELKRISASLLFRWFHLVGPVALQDRDLLRVSMYLRIELHVSMKALGEWCLMFRDDGWKLVQE